MSTKQTTVWQVYVVDATEDNRDDFERRFDGDGHHEYRLWPDYVSESGEPHIVVPEPNGQAPDGLLDRATARRIEAQIDADPLIVERHRRLGVWMRACEDAPQEAEAVWRGPNEALAIIADAPAVR